MDDNLFGYGKAYKERVLKLFRGIVDGGIVINWFCQASLNCGEDTDVLQWASKAGCRMIFIGLESLYWGRLFLEWITILRKQY